jgi:Na+(H+)/acetate symporter ActP
VVVVAAVEVDEGAIVVVAVVAAVVVVTAVRVQVGAEIAHSTADLSYDVYHLGKQQDRLPTGRTE